MTILLNASDLRRTLDWPSVADAVRRGFIEQAEGRVLQPTRIVLRAPSMAGACLVMPCAVPALELLGTKIASVFPRNAALNLPTISALYALLDYTTGECLAIMDGAVLTAFRTAAASVEATKVLARSDARTLGIIGTGMQAEFHVRAFAALLPSLDIHVVSRTPQDGHALRARLACDGIEVDVVSLADAVMSDVLVTATSATEPLFDGRMVREGTHINSVGSHAPRVRELDTAVVVRSRVIADSTEAVFAESGDILLPIEEGAITREHVLGELGEVLSGALTGRNQPTDITLFKSNGLAFQDAVTADIAYRRAMSAGRIAEVDLTN